MICPKEKACSGDYALGYGDFGELPLFGKDNIGMAIVNCCHSDSNLYFA